MTPASLNYAVAVGLLALGCGLLAGGCCGASPAQRGWYSLLRIPGVLFAGLGLVAFAVTLFKAG